jgi:hypothetical protein
VALLSDLINSTSVLEVAPAAQSGSTQRIATGLSCTNPGGYGERSVLSALVSATSPPAARTATRHRAQRDSRRRRAVVATTLIGIAAAAIAVEFARDAVTPRLFHAANGLVGGMPVGMAVAGWCTYGLLPLAAILLDRDHRCRYGRADVGALTDSTLLMRRIKASDGHRLARRPWIVWVWRVPVAALVALAVVFLPIPGDGHGDLVATMQATRGGAAFLIGWQWTCVAAVLGTMIIVMGPVATALRPRKELGRMPIGTYIVAAALSLAALAVAIVSA